LKKKIDNLNLDSKALGALPIINHFIDRLNLHEVVSKYVPSKKNQKLSNADSILIFVRNILIERQPLYGLSEWIDQYDPHMVGLSVNKPTILNDDRVGRSLDTLFDADRASLLTEIVMKTIYDFNIDLSQLHNDSTTVTVYGEYKMGKTKRKGKPSIAITHGYNKDHRPDLKQLLFSLTVSRDGAVPIHYKAFNGNTTDDKTHIQIWENICRIAGRSDFIYVADSKLCTREQMGYITKEGGRFISVLPETRKECRWFKAWLRTHSITWQELHRRPDHRKPDSGVHIYWGHQSPTPSEEGYRIIWILSSQKQEQDAQNREQKINKTIESLSKLKEKIGTSKLKTKEKISTAVEKILDKYSSNDWFDWKTVPQEIESYKQKGKGRPGDDTEYIKKVKQIWTFEAMPNWIKIQDDAATDGIFPLITNICDEKELSMKDVLMNYKFQPYIEKRHQQFKSVFDVAPIFLKLPHRIEALMFVYFIVLLLNALIERELRLSMQRENISLLPLYPEERCCKYPTTNRIISLFANQRRHILMNKEKVLKYFYDPISDLQETILELLKVSKENYE